jgi:hypothetical protein
MYSLDCLQFSESKELIQRERAYVFVGTGGGEEVAALPPSRLRCRMELNFPFTFFSPFLVAFPALASFEYTTSPPFLTFLDFVLQSDSMTSVH